MAEITTIGVDPAKSVARVTVSMRKVSLPCGGSCGGTRCSRFARGLPHA
jgi:hypothetical protein